MSLFAPVLACLLACSSQSATPQLVGVLGRPDRLEPTVRPTGRTLVSGFGSNAIHVFDTATGAFQTTIAPVPGAQSIVTGPDGDLFACAEAINQILRIDPETLTIVSPFVFDDLGTGLDETGGLDGPTSAIFGPDGNLYVASFNTDEILRYDGSTGAFLDVFVAAGSGALNGPDAGMAFGPGEDLFVPSFFNHRILRYDGTTGTFVSTFISSSPGNMFQPRAIVFEGSFCYVASSLNNRVLRYDLNGVFQNRFTTDNQPYSMAFQPQDGHLYVVSLGLNSVRKHDGVGGKLINTIIASGAGGLAGATYLHFLVP